MHTRPPFHPSAFEAFRIICTPPGPAPWAADTDVLTLSPGEFADVTPADAPTRPLGQGRRAEW